MVQIFFGVASARKFGRYSNLLYNAIVQDMTRKTLGQGHALSLTIAIFFSISESIRDFWDVDLGQVDRNEDIMERGVWSAFLSICIHVHK